MAGAERARAKRTPAAAEAALRILAAAMEPGGVMDVRTERDALLAEKARVGEGAEDALEAVRAQAMEFADKYFKLVWFGRRAPPEPGHPSYAPYMDTFREFEGDPDFDAIKNGGPASTWQHAYNSGVLAVSRLFLELAASREKDVYHSFEGFDDEEEDRSVRARLQRQRASWKEMYPDLST